MIRKLKISYNVIDKILFLFIFIFSTNTSYSKRYNFFDKDPKFDSVNITWDYNIDFNVLLIYDSIDEAFIIFKSLYLSFGTYFSPYTLFFVESFVSGIFYLDQSNENSRSNFIYSYNINKLFFQDSGDRYKIFLGRDYFTVGSGRLLNNISDGILLEWKYAGFQIDASTHYTGLIHSVNPDLNSFSRRLEDFSSGSKKLFSSLGLSYKIARQKIYIGFLKHWDFKQYEYNIVKNESENFLVGININAVKSLLFQFEFIYQTGKQPAFLLDNNLSNIHTNIFNIRAFAFLSNIKYASQLASSFSIELQYLLASGHDNDDLIEESGKRIYYGFHEFARQSNGFAFSPDLHNIHILKLQSYFAPFYYTNLFKRMFFIINYFLYFKKVTNVRISDANATENHQFIGQSIDATISWSIFIDLSMAIQSGIFIKGNAYPKKSLHYKIAFILTYKI